MEATDTICLRPEDIDADRSRCRHSNFMAMTWQKSDEPFFLGQHTAAICGAIDNALEKYRQGKSTFLTIRVPIRHGKSDMVSRYLPAHFLGEFPDSEAILCTYGSQLSHSFSRFGMRLIDSPEYRALYPDTRLERGERSVQTWGIAGHQGHASFVGLGSGYQGKGGALIILDDIYSGRAAAESAVIRDKAWEAFSQDLVGRRAPVSIVIVMGSPWHKDDIFGRIEAAKGTPNFPEFEDLTFPALSDHYEGGTLFPQRYSAEWYSSMAALLGTYGTASLLQCNPVARGGNMFRVDNIRELDAAQFPQGLLWVRGYDLASSAKERTKSDPDYTVGVKLAAVRTKSRVTGMMHTVIFIDDIMRGQWEAGQREKMILACATKEEIPIGIEAFGAYKDAYTNLRDMLMGARGVTSIQLPGDKVAKASILEPIVEAGCLCVRKGAPWVQDLKAEMADFPSGKHDDMVDAICVALALTQRNVTAERVAL